MSSQSGYVMPVLTIVSFIVYLLFRFYMNRSRGSTSGRPSWTEQEQGRIRRRRRARLSLEEMERRRELILKNLVIKIVPSQRDDKDEETPQVVTHQCSSTKEINQSAGHSDGKLSSSSSGSVENDNVMSSNNEKAHHTQGNILSGVIQNMTSLLIWPDSTKEQGPSKSPKEYDEAACPICLEPYKPGDEVCWSANEDCPHSFHLDCMMKWLMTHDDCPLCRADYLNVKKKETRTSSSTDSANGSEEDAHTGVASSRDRDEEEGEELQEDTTP